MSTTDTRQYWTTLIEIVRNWGTIDHWRDVEALAVELDVHPTALLGIARALSAKCPLFDNVPAGTTVGGQADGIWLASKIELACRSAQSVEELRHLGNVLDLNLPALDALASQLGIECPLLAEVHEQHAGWTSRYAPVDDGRPRSYPRELLTAIATRMAQWDGWQTDAEYLEAADQLGVTDLRGNPSPAELKRLYAKSVERLEREAEQVANWEACLTDGMWSEEAELAQLQIWRSDRAAGVDTPLWTLGATDHPDAHGLVTYADPEPAPQPGWLEAFTGDDSHEDSDLKTFLFATWTLFAEEGNKVDLDPEFNDALNFALWLLTFVGQPPTRLSDTLYRLLLDLELEEVLLMLIEALTLLVTVSYQMQDA